MAKKETKPLVKCDICGEEVKLLHGHKMMKHTKEEIAGLRAQVADLTAKLAVSETRSKELPVPVNTVEPVSIPPVESISVPATSTDSPPPASVPASATILSDVDKKAMFEDWVNNSLTQEAWQTIGEFKGWIVHEGPALVSDSQQDTSKTSATKLVLNVRR